MLRNVDGGSSPWASSLAAVGATSCIPRAAWAAWAAWMEMKTCWPASLVLAQEGRS